MKTKNILMTVLLVAGIALPVQAASISVNLALSATVDNQRVDAGETALVGLSGAEIVDGSGWNNITLGSGVPGNMATFIANTQGGSSIALIDDTATASGVTMTSVGSFYSNYANASTPNMGATGDGGLMQGYLNLDDTESVVLSGLSTWAPNGYKVYAVFDIGPFTRTYGISAGDGSTSELYWTADTTTDSDINNDGTIEWLQTAATTSGSAITDANYAVYGTFSGDTLTLSGTSGFRSVLSGFQVAALPEPGRVLVDFSDASATAGADTNGNYWNTVDPSVTNLVDENNADTAWDIAVTLTGGSGFGGTGVNGPAGSDPLDQTFATIDGIYSQGTSAVVTILLTDLVANTQYDFTAIGGRASGGTDATIDVTTGTGATGLRLLNDGTLLEFSVTSDATGTIEFEFYGDANNATLNAMTITQVPEPATMSLLALGGIAMLKRRKRA